MFNLAKSEVGSRFMVARQFLSLASAIEDSRPAEAASCKGLLFVQIYGVYEYAIRSSVQATLAAVRKDSIPTRRIRRELLTLILNPLWKAAAESGRRRLWEQRIGLMAGVDSNGPLITLDDTLFPSDGTHYRSSQLYTIWRVFGINKPIVPENRHLGRIEELVENRNAIAHGRKTAEEVGRRYSTAELKKRIDDVFTLTNYIISTMETHYLTGALRR